MGIKYVIDSRVGVHPDKKIIPVKVKPKQKKNTITDLDVDVVFNQNVTKGVLPYLFLHITKVSDDYNVSFKDILLLLYLKELQVFDYKINVFGEEVFLKNLFEKGFIDNDFSYKKKNYWCLGKKGIEVVEYFYSSLLKNDELIALNRGSDIDVESKLKSTLSSLFSSKN